MGCWLHHQLMNLDIEWNFLTSPKMGMTSYPIPFCQRHEEKQAIPGYRKTREEMCGLLRSFFFGQWSKSRERCCQHWDLLQVWYCLARKHNQVFPSENLPQPFKTGFAKSACYMLVLSFRLSLGWQVNWLTLLHRTKLRFLCSFFSENQRMC